MLMKRNIICKQLSLHSMRRIVAVGGYLRSRLARTGWMRHHVGIDSHSLGFQVTGRDAGERRLRAGCLGAAAALHAVLIGGAWWHPPAHEHTVDAADTLVVVELAPAAPPVVAPPQLPQPPPRPVRTLPVPKPIPQPELRPEIIPAAIDVVAEPAPAPEWLAASASEVINATQPAAQTASAPAPSAAASAASTQQALSLWQAQLLAHLQRYRRYPRQAERLRQQGISHVRFLVDRQGRISQPRIEHASGYRLLDEETLATVRRASPAPPPPPEVKGNPVEVVVPVSFYLRRR